MTDANQTISDRIQDKLDELTRAERQLALSILENYPASGLGPLAALAKGANVSVPTVARMVQKLGFKGYPEFQANLRDELGAIAKGPIAKHETWAEAAPSEHILNRFTDAVIDNMTSDDALTAGKTLLQGGSKEDAAIAVVKGRAENKIEGLTGTAVNLDDVSKDGMIEAGKEIGMEKAQGSASTYGDKAAGSAKTYSDKAAGSATTYGDKAAGSHTTNGAPIIPKSGGTIVEPAPSAAPLNCPAGTKDAGDGTCMITGDWTF